MPTVSLHCRFLCNFIALADFYHFSAFSWLENFLRHKSVILNICTLTINKINSYRFRASCPDSCVVAKVALYSVMIFRCGKIFWTNRVFKFIIESILKYWFLVISITRNRFSSELILKWTGTGKNGVSFNISVTWLNNLNLFTNRICAKERNRTFLYGQRFDNRQVNNFLINQGVMSTWKNKFYCLSKFAQLQFANYSSVTAQLQFAQLYTCTMYCSCECTGF